jgi:hypothetical protein
MKVITCLLSLILYSFALFYSVVFAKDNEVTTEEYAVYSAVIQGMFIKEKVKTIVISKQTTFYDYKSIWQKPEDYIRVMLEQLRPITLDTVEDLERKNKEQSELGFRLNLTARYVLLDRQAPTNTPEAYAERWRSFYDKYLDSPGIISLSRVGFNANRDQGIVYVANTCGGLCGKGYYMLLTKSSKGWKIERDLMLWVS